MALDLKFSDQAELSAKRSIRTARRSAIQAPRLVLDYYTSRTLGLEPSSTFFHIFSYKHDKPHTPYTQSVRAHQYSSHSSAGALHSTIRHTVIEFCLS